MKFLMIVSLSVLSFSSMASSDFGDLENAKEFGVPTSAENLINIENTQENLYPLGKGDFNYIPRAYDPINKTKYQKVMVGKTFKASYFSSYTHWRYVTVYNVKTEAERIAYLPYFEEECFDNSVFMAQWGESRSISVTLKSEIGASVGVGDIGLSASVGMSIQQGMSFSTQRRVRAVEGIRARHYPMKLSDNYVGVTYIQTYNENKETYGYLTKSLYEDMFGGYPYAFELDNQNVGFKVKREILEYCQEYDSTEDPVRDSVLYHIKN